MVSIERPHGPFVAVLVVAVVGSLFTGGIVLGTTPVAADGDDGACEPEHAVTHDDFRYDEEAIDNAANSSTGGESIESNTRVVVEDRTAFVGVEVENPNTYCVEITIELHEDVVSPATLGTVRLANGTHDVNADWRSSYDFDADETYTVVTIMAPAESELTYAPSEARVKTLAWTGEAQDRSGGFIENVTGANPFGFFENDLEERTYTYETNGSETTTVSLNDPDSDRQIEDWHATYQLDGEDRERILDSDSSAPVFYREIEDNNMTAIEITANEPAEITFVADPTVGDELSYEVTGFRDALSDVWPSSTPLTVGSGSVVAFVGGVA